MKHWSVNEDGYKFIFAEGVVGEEQLQKTEMQMLAAEGVVERLPDGYLLSHLSAVAMEDEQRERFSLPEVFPYTMEVKTHLIALSSDFCYELRYIHPDGVNILIPKVKIGSYIEIEGLGAFMFNYDQYKIVTEIATCNRSMRSLKKMSQRNQQILSSMVVIKKAAEKVASRLEKNIENKKIAIPESLSIRVEKDASGKYIVQPVFKEKRDGENKLISAENELVKKFSKSNFVKSSYLGDDKTHFIIPDNVRKGLEQVKTYNKKYADTNREKAEKLVKFPGDFFTEEVFEFNLDDYSDRVIGYGPWQNINVPYVPLHKGSWLPEEGTFIIYGMDEKGKTKALTIDKNNIDEAFAAYKKAKDQDEEVFSYADCLFNASDVEKDLAEAHRNNEKGSLVGEEDSNIEVSEDSTDANKSLSKPEKRKKEEKVLLIKTNYEGDERYGKDTAADGSKLASLREMPLDAGLRKVIPGGPGKVPNRLEIYEHQEEGIRWLRERFLDDKHKGALLADDMGLGKTLQSMALFAGLKEYFNLREKDMKSVLIVAPVSLLRNWKNEISTFVNGNVFNTKIFDPQSIGNTDNGDVVELYSSGIRKFPAKADGSRDFSSIEKNKIVLTTYETLRALQLSLGKIEWSVMIADEVQKIKNPLIATTHAVKAMNYEFAIALTGTPIENSWSDLWSIMDFAVPGHLNTLKEFNDNYETPLRQILDVETTSEQTKKEIISLGKELEKDLEPVYKRRLKKDIAVGLPKKESKSIEDYMTGLQARAYERIIEESKTGKIRPLQLIQALRDISLFPNLALYDETVLAEENISVLCKESVKLKILLMNIIPAIKAKNEKVLIFVISKKMQRILKNILERQYGFALEPPINGEVLAGKRQQIIDNFSSKDGFNVLILSPEAAGAGLNIKAANHVVHLSRCWNPAKEDQATDRCYRIGQDKDVTVYFPLGMHKKYGRETFDFKLHEYLGLKRQLSASVIVPATENAIDFMRVTKSVLEGAGISSERVENIVDYVDMDFVRRLNGNNFEQLVLELFKNIYGRKNVEHTGKSGDQGADLVVLPEENNNEGILIQCKKSKDVKKHMDDRGIKEVNAARACYEKRYNGCRFTRLMVITNVNGFTQGAKDLAEANKVELVCGDKLDELLKKYPVSRGILESKLRG